MNPRYYPYVPPLFGASTTTTHGTRSASTTPIPVHPVFTPNIDLDENIAGHRQKNNLNPVMRNQWKRRSLVVEREAGPPQSTSPELPATSRRSSSWPSQRLPHSSDAQLMESTDLVAGTIGIPLYYLVRSPSKQDLFPAIPSAADDQGMRWNSRSTRRLCTPSNTFGGHPTSTILIGRYSGSQDQVSFSLILSFLIETLISFSFRVEHCYL